MSRPPPPSSSRPAPVDDLQLHVGEWIANMFNNPDVRSAGANAVVEVEAKLGVLIAKDSGRRMQLPIETEAVVSNAIINHYRFESNMSMNQHAGFNAFLNKLFQEARGEITYNHRYELDRFYKIGNRKVRESVNKKTGEILGIIEKKRIADLHIHFPRDSLDCRLSINLEIEAATPPSDLPIDFTRDKDRMSYALRFVQVDLTQVESNGRKTHELEFEIRQSANLAEEVRLLHSRQANRYQSIIGALVSSIRQCTRESGRLPI
ncbi:CYTH-like domain-containing protein [Zopfochytrium polystomum]|nr:CYTH-like domain-containing protein [Zopfochytrium polystomum]